MYQLETLDKRIEKEFISKEIFDQFMGDMNMKEGKAAADMSEKSDKLNSLIK